MSKRETSHKKDNSSGRPSNPKCLCTNNGTSKYIKLKLSELKRETDVIVGIFKIIALSVNRHRRQKIRKAIEDLKNTMH